jgi:hypothetical protein
LNKQTGLINKIIVIGLRTLFIITMTVPEIIAFDDHKKNSNESTNKYYGNETYDGNWELITRMQGYAKINWINIRGEHGNHQYGEAEIIKGNYDGMNILGIRVTKGFKKIFYERWVEYIYAPSFIGHEMLSMVPGHEGYAVFGYAFGNIDWY